MEQITVGQLVAALAFIVSAIGGVQYVKKNVKIWINNAVKEPFDNVNAKIDHLEDKMEGIDVATCKNFLVARLAELDKGMVWDEIEKERFWEQYEHYTKHGGNSYIQARVEKLKEKGEL